MATLSSPPPLPPSPPHSLTGLPGHGPLYGLDPLPGLPPRPRLEADAARQVGQEDGVAVAGVAEARTHLEA